MPRASKQALRRAYPLERKLLVLMSEAQSISTRLANIVEEVRTAEIDAKVLEGHFTRATDPREEVA